MFENIQVTHVINFDFPLNPSDYIHRAGRVGRVGGCKVGVQLSQVLLSFICPTIACFSGRSGHQLRRQPGRGQSCAEFGDRRQEEYWNPTGGLQMLYRGNYFKPGFIFRWTATLLGSSSSEEKDGRENRSWENKNIHSCFISSVGFAILAMIMSLDPFDLGTIITSSEFLQIWKPQNGKKGILKLYRDWYIHLLDVKGIHLQHLEVKKDQEENNSSNRPGN